LGKPGGLAVLQDCQCQQFAYHKDVTPRVSDFSPPLQQTGRTHVRLNGRKLIYFGGCDYFRLSRHPKVISAIEEGLRQFGLNPAASRFTTGNHIIYEELEESMRAFFVTDSATLASTGYATNLIVAQALHGEFTHALIDSRAHQSLQDSAAFLGCPVISFAHRDPESVRSVLRKLRRPRLLLLTDGLFSHDGALAPLQDYLSILPQDSCLLVDDAHGAGTLGKHGRGTCELLRVHSERIIQTISLSKAFGTFGGAILSSEPLRKKMIARSRLLQGNTPLPLPLANASLCSLNILKSEPPLRQRLQSNIQSLRRKLGKRAQSHPAAPVFPVYTQSSRDRQNLKEKLLEAQIHPPEIAYGTGEPYFRFAISSEHQPAQIATLAEILRIAAR
jgi:8-amino-7-oxononanoate synthase